MKKTFQIAACENGWRKAKPLIFEDITIDEAMLKTKELVKQYAKEARLAEVTGYPGLYKRNSLGEFLGNGIYVHPNSL